MPFYPFGGGQPDNPDRAYEPLGWGANGAGTLVETGATAFTKGSWVSLGETMSDWCGFDIIFGSSTSSGVKVHVDIGTGEPSSQVAIISDLFTMTSIAGNTMAEDGVFVPLKVAAGTKLWARTSAQAVSASPKTSQAVSLYGLKAAPDLPPGFDNCALLNGAQATGYAGGTNVLMDGTWALLHTTARPYGAILVTPGTGTGGQTLQEIALRIGTGEATFEAEIFRTKVLTVNANPSVKTGGDRRLIETAIDDSVRISASCLATSTGANPIRVGLHGFY